MRQKKKHLDHLALKGIKIQRPLDHLLLSKEILCAHSSMYSVLTYVNRTQGKNENTEREGKT